MSTVQLISARRSVAADIHRRALLGDASSDRLAFDCAILRSCVWALSRGRDSVHTTRILNLAVRSMVDSEPHAVKHDRERLREALDELTDVGDIIELAGGRWLAAFTRQVALGTDTDERLVVGGVPTALLPTELRGLLLHRGALRVTRGGALGSALSLADETLESWLGDSPADLEQWARSLLAQELDAYSPEEGARFRVYVPALARPHEPQGFRWREQLGRLDGRYFADRELAFGVRQSRIIEIRGGRVIASGVPSLGGGERRRLLYALDALARNPTRVMVRVATSLSLVLQSELPRAEQRVFAALGDLSVPEEKYYPRTWTFRLEHKRTILARLAALRIDVSHETK